jgi:replicative DNA helicase
MDIRETQIEDILVSAPVLTKKILNLDDEPRLIGRQILIPSRRLDLLYTYQTKFLLIELKVISFQNKFIQQILQYKKELVDFQKSGKLLRCEIQPYLLCPSIRESQRQIAGQEGVFCLEYNPEEILSYFYDNLRPVASFVEIKPIDIGIWNLHLINKS